MIDQRKPFYLTQPITVVTGLSFNPSAGSDSNVDLRALSKTVQHWTACLQVTQTVIERLFQLWNGLLALEADEISDWSLQALCNIVAPVGATVPPILGVTATVYANGDVSCAVTVEGIDQALSFVEVIDLGEFDASVPQVAALPGATG